MADDQYLPKIFNVFFLSSSATISNGIRTISEAVSQREPANVGGKGGRHAVIRRHQSMYIHPRATELVPPSFTELPAFHMQEASGKSEVRPIGKARKQMRIAE